LTDDNYSGKKKVMGERRSENPLQQDIDTAMRIVSAMATRLYQPAAAKEYIRDFEPALVNETLSFNAWTGMRVGNKAGKTYAEGISHEKARTNAGIQGRDIRFGDIGKFHVVYGATSGIMDATRFVALIEKTESHRLGNLVGMYAEGPRFAEESLQDGARPFSELFQKLAAENIIPQGSQNLDSVVNRLPFAS